MSERNRDGLYWNLFSPLIYTTLIVPVAVAMLLVAGFSDYWRNPGLVAVLPSLLTAVAVFGVCGWLLLRVERLQRPTMWDHLRRCATFYAIAALVSPFVVAEYLRSQSESLAGGYGLIAVFVAILAIVTDAIMLLGLRLHSLRFSGGGSE